MFTETVWQDGKWEAREFCGQGFVPDPLPPVSLDINGLLIDLWPAIVEAERSLSRLEGTARRLPNPHLLTGAFSHREAILSSAIENTFASAEQIVLLDLQPSAIADQDRDPVQEVSNYVRALHHGLTTELPVCLRLIREMHAILLDKIERQDVQPGQFRTAQNAIGTKGRPFPEARFVPPPPAFLDTCMANLERYMNAQDTTTPRLVRFALIHYQFEAIHPFADGNGRLGRLLVTLLTCRQGQLTQPLVYLSGYFEKNRDSYYDHLYRISTEGTWRPWIEFFLQAVITQAADAIDRADRLIDLQTQFHEKVRKKRASALLPRLVDHLFSSPAVTVAGVKRVLDCSTQTATNHVNRLVDAGILTEVTGSSYGRVFVCPQIAKLINR